MTDWTQIITTIPRGFCLSVKDDIERDTKIVNALHERKDTVKVKLVDVLMRMGGCFNAIKIYRRFTDGAMYYCDKQITPEMSHICIIHMIPEMLEENVEWITQSKDRTCIEVWLEEVVTTDEQVEQMLRE